IRVKTNVDGCNSWDTGVGILTATNDYVSTPSPEWDTYHHRHRELNLPLLCPRPGEKTLLLIRRLLIYVLVDASR
ncbi:hypothetical protein AVEN_187654-1, partial [Araneus ventricosus]